MLTVLVCEDDPDNAQILVRRLESRGYTVHHALDGESAVQLSARHRPDVVLMDVRLPGIDGLETTRQLKREPATAHIPVIIMTASSYGPDDHLLAASAGASGFLVKPTSFNVLLDEIHRSVATAP